MSKYTSPLLNRVCSVIRAKHYSRSTEEAYASWIKRYIIYHHKRHPKDMGVPEIEAFLTHLAIREHVAATTQNQAFCAILFLYRHVLHIELDGRIEALRAKRPQRRPTILTPEEVFRIIDEIEGEYRLMLELIYGCGLRLNECMSLRVKDIDFGLGQILIRDAKGMKDRVTMLPEAPVEPLHEHLCRVKKRPRASWPDGE